MGKVLRERMAQYDPHVATGHYVQDPYHDVHNDPYFMKKKLKDGTVCKGCGVEFRKGRLHWPKVEDSRPEETKLSFECPACIRIREKMVGGVVIISGEFFKKHESEIDSLIRNTESKEMNEHPLQRIVSVERLGNSTREVNTTYEHLARRIGEALKHAYQGLLDIHYAEDEKFVRVVWSRDD